MTDDQSDSVTLPVEIQSLMRAQVLAAHELPYRLPGARRPSLATVYVCQDLSSGTEEPRPEASRPTPILDGHGQLVEVPQPPVVRVAVRPPARTLREALDSDEHLLITGGAGQGKSTLSLRLAADIAARWCADNADQLRGGGSCRGGAGAARHRGRRHDPSGVALACRRKPGPTGQARA